MTVIAFPTRHAPRPATDDTLPADCERLTGTAADKIRAAMEHQP